MIQNSQQNNDNFPFKNQQDHLEQIHSAQENQIAKILIDDPQNKQQQLFNQNFNSSGRKNHQQNQAQFNSSKIKPSKNHNRYNYAHELNEYKKSYQQSDKNLKHSKTFNKNFLQINRQTDPSQNKNLQLVNVSISSQNICSNRRKKEIQIDKKIFLRYAMYVQKPKNPFFLPGKRKQSKIQKQSQKIYQNKKYQQKSINSIITNKKLQTPSKKFPLLNSQQMDQKKYRDTCFQFENKNFQVFLCNRKPKKHIKKNIRLQSTGRVQCTSRYQTGKITSQTYSTSLINSSLNHYNLSTKSQNKTNIDNMIQLKMPSNPNESHNQFLQSNPKNILKKRYKYKSKNSIKQTIESNFQEKRKNKQIFNVAEHSKNIPIKISKSTNYVTKKQTSIKPADLNSNNKPLKIQYINLGKQKSFIEHNFLQKALNQKKQSKIKDSNSFEMIQIFFPIVSNDTSVKQQSQKQKTKNNVSKINIYSQNQQNSSIKIQDNQGIGIKEQNKIQNQRNTKKKNNLGSHNQNNKKSIQEQKSIKSTQDTTYMKFNKTSIKKYHGSTTLKDQQKFQETQPEGPIFIFDSKDHPYVASYLKQSNWRQYYSMKISPSYKLKWVNNPVYPQILKLKADQFYNHFHKSFQLTSKGFMNANLKANKHLVSTYDFYPECYDIGNEAERQQFVQSYNYKKIVEYCQQSSKFVQYLDFHIEQMNKLNQLNQQRNQQSLLKLFQHQDQKLQNQYFNPIQFQNFKKRDETFLLNILLVTQALRFYRKQRKKYQIDFNYKYFHYLNFNQKQFGQYFNLIQTYAKRDNLAQPCAQLGLGKQYFATPSQLLLSIISKQYLFFHNVNKWKYNIRDKIKNQSNVWIVKPSSNARGNGIYIQTNINVILKSAKDIQSRIVQKYIQRPLLLKNTKYEYLNNHKFDIRQWVLIKSLSPLEIYMFQKFYIRLASEKYSINTWNNSNIHLTNFSFNKKKFKNNQHSIVNSDDFCEFIKEQLNIQWEKDIKPKIKSIIIKSIQACQQKLQNSPEGACFELLGYDILLDEKGNPWLIEVNMSPACQERTAWLSQYLKDMNQQLLQIILPPSLLKKQNKCRKYLWQKIHHEQYFYTNKQVDNKLQIIGQALGKNKNSKQNDGIGLKSKQSFELSCSPSKFKRRSSIKKDRLFQSPKKKTIQYNQASVISQFSKSNIFQEAKKQKQQIQQERGLFNQNNIVQQQSRVLNQTLDKNYVIQKQLVQEHHYQDSILQVIPQKEFNTMNKQKIQSIKQISMLQNLDQSKQDYGNRLSSQSDIQVIQENSKLISQNQLQ